MPSPYEDTPEYVEGVRPYYQYFLPGYGYTYAEGGMVALEAGGLIGSDEYTIDDLYRILGSK
jgi:hypothetical protein